MNKGNREQKPMTKKLAEFHNQFVLLTMFYRNICREVLRTKQVTLGSAHL